ncbi:MAG TPA: helix-turn-helix domain-containing protein [Thermoleophilaceae bacterium]|nr:helix-turn-helix domain-containing protein [Thermoleophilaceae bacterium]
MSEVLPRTYDSQVCSIARALETIGDRWTLLVIRDLFLGLRRFEDLQRDLGVARNVLTDRLGRLVEDGIVERRLYQERPERYEYRLTAKGLDLWPVMISLMKWGDRHSPDEGGAPTVVVHRDCGGEIDERFNCRRCGEPIDVRSAQVLRRPDLMPAPAA